MTEPSAPPGFETLLQYLYETHGSDFSGYKPSTLQRRMRKRVDQVHLTSFEEYVDYLQVHPEEFATLFDTILINVTGFFRDPAAWERVRQEVIPRILTKPRDEGVRIWCAGCASGQEAYSIAILLAEAMGANDFRLRGKVYATDVDEQALSRARQGVYGVKELTAVPEDLRERYFDGNGQRGSFSADLRRSVIFGRHDLLQDAPISRIDLIVCRNTLMYFTAESQSRILARLHYALNDTGFLFVGRAEMLLTHANLFTPLDLKQRIFAKVAGPNFRPRVRVLTQPGPDPISNHVGRQVRLREAALDAGRDAVVIVDSDGVLVMANEMARNGFGVTARDVGRRLQDVEISYRPVELRSLIEQAMTERRTLEVSGVERPVSSDVDQYLDVLITPLSDADGDVLGVAATFRDVTSSMRLQAELTRSRQELETAYEELQSTNEELETTNEELQSTVEELETTNEELQSANEELETMNEELESTNSELQSINSELHRRSSEVDRLNTFLDSVLGSIDLGVAVLDADLRVVLWNERSTDMWGLREWEVTGQPFITLDIGLPVADLAGPIRQCMAGGGGDVETTLAALTRRGRTVRCRVVCRPIEGSSGADGVVVLMQDMGPVEAGDRPT